MFTSFRQRLGELSLTAKIPAICQWRNMAEAGCLASYGITTEELYSLSADQIAKLLKGAAPADLPVQQRSNAGGKVTATILQARIG